MTNDEEGKDCDNLACQAELMRERGETADSRPGLWPAESQQEANQDRGEERERERERTGGIWRVWEACQASSTPTTTL